MRLSKAIFFLLTLACASGGWYWWKHREPETQAAAAPEPTNFVAAAIPQPTVVTQELVVVTNDFSWKQLESEDYRTYIARLRTIGCPEQTIRDIIIADLDKLMAPGMQAIYGRKKNVNYWESEEEELANDRDHREWAKKEREIDQKKREIIRELMGVDLARERLKQKGFQDYYERRLGFLPEEKRGDIRAILEKYDDEERALRDKELEEGENLSDADRARLKQLREKRQQELAGALSPEEQHSYELWMSPSANAVRYSMYGMQANEQEFLGVYQLRRSFDSQWNPEEIDWNNDAQVTAYQQARDGLESQIRESLGDQRYLEYKRGEDPDFHELNAACTRYNLDSSKALEAYEIKRAVVQSIASLRADASLPPAHVEQMTKRIKGETEFALRQVLGNAAYRYFQQRSGANWFE